MISKSITCPVLLGASPTRPRCSPVVVAPFISPLYPVGLDHIDIDFFEKPCLHGHVASGHRVSLGNSFVSFAPLEKCRMET